MTTYFVWAEHTDGQSVSHPCRRGVYSDPAELLDMAIDAGDEVAAVQAGTRRLRQIVADHPPCDCERRNRLIGTDSWWDSVVVTASRTPYPDVTRDEEHQP